MIPSQTFIATTTMLYHRSNHRSVLLPDGRVLAIGGTTLESGFLFINEAYDPSTQTWSPHDVMVQNRSGHTATHYAGWDYLRLRRRDW